MRNPPNEKKMQLTFLQADRPLTKKFTRRADGGYDTESYPMLFRVTSHTEEVETIDEFASALKKHAELGHCLHTGSLDKVLSDESRKGHHDRDEERDWIVLDLDGLSAFNGVEEFLKELPDPFQTASYIVQHSPSSGIKPGLRAHVFFMLDRAESMKDIKTWTTHINLVTEKLRNEITLTAKDFALSYPLDRIANDNGRVVYITPPECVGFSDPIEERIRVVYRENDRLRHDFRSSVVSDVKGLERKCIDELRAAKGLKVSRVKDLYEQRNDIEVLKKSLTEPGRIHPVREDSEFVVRCNLDDGDSEAYFYYTKNPTLLRNHKGEPALYMEKVDPEFYQKVALPVAKKMWEKDKQAFVFKNLHDDKYWVGSRIGHEIVDQPHKTGSEDKIAAWYRQVSPALQPPGMDEIETWEMRFDPTFEDQWNPDDRIFNMWRRTEIMKSATYRSLPPEIIVRIISHALGNGAEEYNHFINWLAYVYQTRKKTGTAWILHGCQGTGKGLLVDYVLRPIFGDDYIEKQQARNLKAEFNAFLEKAIVVNLDEFDLADAGHDSSQVMQALKMWITDSVINIRAMYAGHRQVRNFSNFILTTNSPNAIPIPPGERRFNFGVRQEERLEITPEEVAAIADELEHFAGYLKGYKVDELAAHTALDNETKRNAEVLSRNTVEEFVFAFRTGDLGYFCRVAADERSPNRYDGLEQDVKKILNEWLTAAETGEKCAVRSADLLKVYQLASGTQQMTVAKFSKMMGHKSVPPAQHRIDGERFRGWLTKWELDTDDAISMKRHLKAVPTDLEAKIKKEVESPGEPT